MDYRTRYFLLSLSLLLGCNSDVSFEELKPEMSRALAIMERDSALETVWEQNEAFSLSYGDRPTVMVPSVTTGSDEATVDSMLTEMGLAAETYHGLVAIIESTELEGIQTDAQFEAVRFITQGGIVDEFGFVHFADESMADSLQQSGLLPYRVNQIDGQWYQYSWHY